jgi:hypothetical protein
MWEIKIALDNAQPSLVMITALHQDGFSYAENIHMTKFSIDKFVTEAIAQRNKWTVDRDTTMTAANAIAATILTALNKADNIEGIELETVATGTVVECAKKVEVVGSLPIKEL